MKNSEFQDLAAALEGTQATSTVSIEDGSQPGICFEDYCIHLVIRFLEEKTGRISNRCDALDVARGALEKERTDGFLIARLQFLAVGGEAIREVLLAALEKREKEEATKAFLMRKIASLSWAERTDLIGKIKNTYLADVPVELVSVPNHVLADYAGELLLKLNGLKDLSSLAEHETESAHM